MGRCGECEGFPARGSGSRRRGGAGDKGTRAPLTQVLHGGARAHRAGRAGRGLCPVGAGGGGTSGSWRPGRDHVRKPGPAGMGLGGWGGGAKNGRTRDGGV